MNELMYAVVLAWNHLDDTLECLASIAAMDYHPLKIVLVDNGSTDGTSDTVRERFPKVEILRSDTNLGVSGGYNLGMEYAVNHGAVYILIANNDIAVDPFMAAMLVKVLRATPSAGIAMPKIYHYYGDRTRLWCAGASWYSFPPRVKMLGLNAVDQPKYGVVREIEFAPSCCLLLHKQVVEDIGYFDTGYFFYNDDYDYCLRSRKAGHRIVFAPDAKMWHKVSVSTQNSEKPAIWWTYLGRSTVRFYIRYYGIWSLAFFSVWFLIRESIKLKFTHLIPYLKGIILEVRPERRIALSHNIIPPK